MLETILTIVAWVAVAGFAVAILMVLPVLSQMLLALAGKKIRWPGPPDFDQLSTEYRQAQLMGTPYHPKPMFQGFLSNVLGILGSILLLLIFIFFIIPRIDAAGTGTLILYIVLLAFTLLAGVMWVKPAFRSRDHFRLWFAGQ